MKVPNSVTEIKRQIGEILSTSVALLFVLALFQNCSNNSSHSDPAKYTCPMHPAVGKDMPGKCPICNMDLVLKNAKGVKIKMTPALNNLIQSPNETIVSSVKTIFPVRKSIGTEITASGVIASDPRKEIVVPTRFAGRIEKLYILSNDQPIRKGEKIMDVYSAALLNAEKELLFLLNSDKENAVLIEGAKRRLELYGISDAQIKQLMQSGVTVSTVGIYSPADGYVTDVDYDGKSTELSVREGRYIEEGQTLFKIVSDAGSRAEVDINQKDASAIKLNDAATITLASGETREGTVDLIQPFLKSGESFVKVKIVITSMDHLRPGQIVNVVFAAASGEEVLWIPFAAKINLGATDAVFLKTNGVFHPKIVMLGKRAADWIEVISGLTERDSIASKAQFMIDGDGFVKTGN